MRNLLIATNNKHKITEIKSVLSSIKNIKLISPEEFGISEDIVEDGISLEENALIKARALNKISNIPAISDDTGLFVDALNGRPGIYSARFAGEKASYEDNRTKLLNELNSVPDGKRAAYFESVICFYLSEKEYYFFKGKCEGEITYEERGDNGFGYDPVFLPANSKKTFAELSDEEKNTISHRAKALNLFKEFSESFFN